MSSSHPAPSVRLVAGELVSQRTVATIALTIDLEPMRAHLLEVHKITVR